MNKVFFITNELSGGGAERVMSVLANYLCDNGYDVSFLILQDAKQEYPLNIKIKKIIWSERKTGDAIGQIKFIRKYMKINPGSIFVSFFTHQNLYSIIAKCGINTKVFVSERNDPNHSINGFCKKFLRRIIYSSSLCNKIIFQTESVKSYFNSRIQNKSVVIPNPLKDNLPEPYSGEREKTVISFGRLEPQKNYRMLVEAFGIFSKQYPAYRLKIYGKGSEEAKLRSLVEKIGVVGKVDFMGFDQNVHEKILKAGMFVLPSNYEGLSNSMLEAMAIGLPVICTECPSGGAKEYIENGINGLLVPVGGIDYLVDMMKILAEDPLFANRIGNAASKVRYRLETNRVCEVWKQLFAEV